MKKYFKILIIIMLLILLSCCQISPIKVFAEDGTTAEGESNSKNIDDVLGEADAFLKLDEGKGNNLLNVKDTSDLIYNVLLAIGMIVAVIVGIILGIKFMISTVEEKANVKKALVPYFVGCAILFGSFGIWKSVVTVSNNITSLQDKTGEIYKSSISQQSGGTQSGSSSGTISQGGTSGSKSPSGTTSSKNKIPVTKITLNKTAISVDNITNEYWNIPRKRKKNSGTFC